MLSCLIEVFWALYVDIARLLSAFTLALLYLFPRVPKFAGESLYVGFFFDKTTDVCLP